MDILVRDAIIDHLYSKKLIRDTQHGFTQGRSCLTNLLKFLEEVTAYVDEGSPLCYILKCYVILAPARTVAREDRSGHGTLRRLG